MHGLRSKKIFLRYSSYNIFFIYRKCCAIKVLISFLEESKNNQSTFNWGPGNVWNFLTFISYNSA